jgi:hypothetical protein
LTALICQDIAARLLKTPPFLPKYLTLSAFEKLTVIFPMFMLLKKVAKLTRLKLSVYSNSHIGINIKVGHLVEKSIFVAAPKMGSND